MEDHCCKGFAVDWIDIVAVAAVVEDTNNVGVEEEFADVVAVAEVVVYAGASLDSVVMVLHPMVSLEKIDAMSKDSAAALEMAGKLAAAVAAVAYRQMKSHVPSVELVERRPLLSKHRGPHIH